MSVLLSTAEFANRFRVKPESIRHSLCTKGHYLGLRPLKLPNGRLMWSRKGADQLMNGCAGTATGEAQRYPASTISASNHIKNLDAYMESNRIGPEAA